jgi:NAD(P)-dependent dehydrogenase (short-subunit alcohol dehydrogenase family)
MRVVITLDASVAAAAVHVLVAKGAGVGGRVGQAAEWLAPLIEKEGQVIHAVSVLLRRFGDFVPIDLDVDQAYSEDGDELHSSLEGSIDFEVEEFFQSPRLGARRFDRFLEVLAVLRGLELTRIEVRIAGAPSSIDALSVMLLAYAEARGAALRPLAARVAPLVEEGEVDEGDEEWDEVIATNLRGPFLFMRAVSRPMMQQRYGRIINVASVVGQIGNPGQANYSASKAGLIGMTRTVAKELAGRKVTVNAVAPGFIASEMTAALGPLVLEEVKKRVPAKRIGEPWEVAEAVLFLAAPSSAYVTAQVLTVDGGMIG